MLSVLTKSAWLDTIWQDIGHWAIFWPVILSTCIISCRPEVVFPQRKGEGHRRGKLCLVSLVWLSTLSAESRQSRNQIAAVMWLQSRRRCITNVHEVTSNQGREGMNSLNKFLELFQVTSPYPRSTCKTLTLPVLQDWPDIVPSSFARLTRPCPFHRKTTNCLDTTHHMLKGPTCFLLMSTCFLLMSTSFLLMNMHAYSKESLGIPKIKIGSSKTYVISLVLDLFQQTYWKLGELCPCLPELWWLPAMIQTHRPKIPRIRGDRHINVPFLPLLFWSLDMLKLSGSQGLTKAKKPWLDDLLPTTTLN